MFSMSGEYLRVFGKDKLKNPGVISVCNNVYITGYSALYKYTLSGQSVNSITCCETNSMQLNWDRGIILVGMEYYLSVKEAIILFLPL